MGSFTKPLKVKFINNGKQFELLESFSYYRENDKDDIIEVPAGFVSDLASIPRIFWNILPPQGAGKGLNYSSSCFLHDKPYSADTPYSRKEADDIFLESMKAVGVSKIVRYTLYYCVRWFGKSHYKG